MLVALARISSSCDSGAGLRKGEERVGGIRWEGEVEDRKRRKEVVRRVTTPAMKQKRVNAPALMSRRRERLGQVGVEGGDSSSMPCAIWRMLL